MEKVKKMEKPELEKVKHKAPENAFHDLSKNSTMFRQNIIQEFQVLDNVNDLFNVSAPIHSSRDFYSGNLQCYRVYSRE